MVFLNGLYMFIRISPIPHPVREIPSQQKSEKLSLLQALEPFDTNGTNAVGKLKITEIIYFSDRTTLLHFS